MLSNFDYNGKLIQKRDDGFINLTQMCQANDKRLTKWLHLKSTKAYIETIKSEDQKGTSELIEVVKGGQSALQGTWGHPELAIHLAQWISPSFHRWCNAHIFNLMESGNTSLDIDPIAEMKLKIELAKIEAQKEQAIAQAKQADFALTQFRYTITQTCPKPVQEKVLGVKHIREVQRVETVVDKTTGRKYEGVGITYVAKSLGLTNKQAWGWLESIGYGKNSEHWKTELIAATSSKLSREDFEYIYDLFKEQYGDRQMFLGE